MHEAFFSARAKLSMSPLWQAESTVSQSASCCSLKGDKLSVAMNPSHLGNPSNLRPGPVRGGTRGQPHLRCQPFCAGSMIFNKSFIHTFNNSLVASLAENFVTAANASCISAQNKKPGETNGWRMSAPVM